ncbi:hypothetical protein BDC45DRAFT_538799 [Circinella umbellata]|nr:hypothetical protein BDC45DRAFT_538799 [Circinella umbellata]
MSTRGSSASCLTHFVTDPWSTVKVIVPSIAIEVILHKKVWEKASLRHLTLYLTMANVYWFATSFNVGFLETPLLCKVTDGLNKSQKLDLGRNRLGWLNKIELAIGVVTLDLFCEWRKRIIDHDGFVDAVLTTAVLAPAAISLAQGAYILPKLKECCLPSDKVPTVSAGGDSCCSEKSCCRLYLGIEVAKVAGLAVAGLRFGKMLTV